jgi:hypothetical protein
MGECATRTLPVLAYFVFGESLIAEISYMCLYYICPHDHGSHTPASLNIINSALHSRASALLQLIIPTLAAYTHQRVRRGAY